jgi:predicted HicB family RNase H-like nuclease
MPKPKKPGRPTLPKGEAKAETLRIRVTPSELRGYAAKAKASKLSVSEWIRSTLEDSLNG